MTDPITQTLTGPRRNALARRERIISAARALFARQGFHGTGMAQIAQVSEVLVGQIYRDFAGKEDLIAAIVERDVVEMLDDPELAGAMSTGEAAQLNRWLRKFIARRLDQESRSMFADILSEATRNAKIAAIIMQSHDRMRDRLSRAVEVWIPGGDRENVRMAVADLMLTAIGAAQHRQIFGLTCDADLLDKLVEMVERQVASLQQPS